MCAEQELETYYARRAQQYERVYHKPERQADLQTLRKCVSEAFTGKRVLEIACGTGYWTEIISHTAISILGLDINKEVLALARAKPLGPARVTFSQADIFSPPPLSGGFDAAMAGFWWSHVTKARLDTFLRNLHSALEPGASVMFFDNAYVTGSSTPLSRIDSDGNPVSPQDADGNTYQERVLDDGSKYRVLKNFPSEAELRQRLDSLAVNVEIEFLTYYWILKYNVLRAAKEVS